MLLLTKENGYYLWLSRKSRWSLEKKATTVFSNPANKLAPTLYKSRFVLGFGYFRLEGIRPAGPCLERDVELLLESKLEKDAAWRPDGSTQG